VQRRAEIEAGLVLAWLLPAAARWERGRRGSGGGGEPGEVGLDGGVTRGELPLIRVEELEVLLEHEDVFGAVVAGEGGRDLGLRRATTMVAMPGEHGNPVDAGRLHGDVCHAGSEQPLGQPVEVACEGGEGPDRRRVAIGRHSDDVLGRAAIDARRVRMEAFEGVGRGANLRRTTVMAFPARLLYTGAASGNRDADEWQSPKRDPAPQTAGHQ
jgi:hypothetical protein